MSRSTRAVALIAVPVLISTMLIAGPAGAEAPPASAPTEFPTLPNPPAQPAPDPAVPTGFVAGQSVRDVAATTPTRVEYDNPDGTRTAIISAAPTHFQDQAQLWHDTDYRLVQNAAGKLVAASALGSPEFSPRSAGQVVAFPSLPGLSIGFTDAGDVAGTLSDNDHELRYPGALSGGRDIVLSVVTGGIEHHVVVPTAAAGSSYRLVLNVPTAAVVREVPLGVELLNGAGAVIGGLFDGYARDSAVDPATSPVSVNVVGQTGAAVTIEASVDPAWFSDPARVFPVLIDPTMFQTNTTVGALGMYPTDCPVSFDRYSSCDTSVVQGVPASSPYKAIDVRTGKGSNSLDRTLLQFALDSFGTGAYQYQVISSSVNVYNNYSAESAGQYKTYELHPLTSAVTRNTSWNAQPAIDWASETYAEMGLTWAGQPSGWVQFDNTATATRWMNGSLPPYGVAITAQDESLTNTWRTMFSAEGDSSRAPTLYMTYNRPPTPATLVSPANGATVPTTSPTLTVTASDPDGDALSYYFQIATGSDAVSGTAFSSGWISSPSWTVPPGLLAPYTTYYWKAFTHDGYVQVNPTQTWNLRTIGAVPVLALAPVITSSSHPNPALAYDSSTLDASWTTTGEAIDGYSLLLDSAPSTTPDTTIDQTATTKTFTGLDDGVFYVHVRAHNPAGWGPAGHFKVTVATVVAGSDGMGREQFYPYDAKDLGTATTYVGLHNGNLVVAQEDERIPGQGLSVIARRTYNAQSTVDVGMGPGWSLSLADVDTGLEAIDVVDEAGTTAAMASLDPNVSLAFADIRDAANALVGQTLDLVDGDGTTHRFVRRGAVGARWESPPGVSLRVREVTDAQALVVAYQLVRPDGVTTTAENMQAPLGLSTPAWRVTKVTDRNGNELSYDYVGLDLVTGGATVKTPRLSTIRHNRTGAEILVQAGWSPTGQLSSLEFLPATDRRLTQFTYTAGRLTSVVENAQATVAQGQRTTEFGYDATSGLMATAKDARGNTSSFAYTVVGGVSRVTSMVDRRAKTWRWYYGAADVSTGQSVAVATSPIGPATTTAADESSPQQGQISYRLSPKARIDLNDRRLAGPNLVAITTAGTTAGPKTRTYGWYANRLTTITDALGQARSMAYNDLGLLRSATEPSPNDPATPNLPANAPTTPITTTFEYAYPAAQRYAAGSCADPATNTVAVSNEGWCYAAADITRVVAATNVAAQRRITEFSVDSAGNVTRQLARSTSDPIPALGSAPAAADRATTMTYYSRGALRTVDGARTDVADITTFGSTGDAVYGGYHRTGQPLAITDALAKPTAFTYTAFGMVASTTDRDNHATTAAYDARDNRLSVTDAVGSTWAESWDANDNLASRTQARGVATATAGDYEDRFVHDNNDWLTASSTPGADAAAARPTTQYSYNDDGTRATTTSPSNATSATIFWPDRSLKRVTATAGSATTAVTDWAYDGAGRVTTLTRPAANAAGDRPVSGSSYAPGGQVASTSTTTSTGALATTRLVYNAHGDQIAVRGPRNVGGVGEEETATFDVFGQQVATGRKLSASKVLSTYVGFDATGNQVCVAQPTGTAGQDPAACSGGTGTTGGQLVARYGYDVLGRLGAQTVDPVNPGHTVSYSHTDGGQQISRIDSVSGTARRTTMTAFNTDNTLQTRHVIDHSNGKTLTTCYIEPGQPVGSGYDADKNVRAVETRTGSTSSCGGGSRLTWDSFTTDHRGMLSGATKRVRHPAAGSPEVARVQSFSYRPDGELASRTNNGKATVFTHSAGGQLERITDWLGYHTVLANTASGSRLFECLQTRNGTCSADSADAVWNYNPDGSLSGLEDFLANHTATELGAGARVSVRSHAAIAYDPAGLRTAETVTVAQPPGSTGAVGGFQALYGHDLAGRLISWTSPFARADTSREAQAMSIDDGGNATQTQTTAAEGADSVAATSSFTTGRLTGRVTDATSAVGTTRTVETYGYTPLGEEAMRTTTVTPPAVVGAPTTENTSTSYDPVGFAATSTTGPTTVGYSYDPATERVLTRAEGAATTIYWSWGAGSDVAEETTADGSSLSTYLTGDDGVAVAVQSVGWALLLPDSAGNEATVIEGGTVLSQSAFRPYGSVEARGSGRKAGTAASPSSMGFQAAITDRTTGAVLVGPRQYDPSIERFTNPDAYVGGLADLGLGTDDLTGNRYLFAAGNPTRYYEDGHTPFESSDAWKAMLKGFRRVARQQVLKTMGWTEKDLKYNGRISYTDVRQTVVADKWKIASYTVAGVCTVSTAGWCGAAAAAYFTLQTGSTVQKYRGDQTSGAALRDHTWNVLTSASFFLPGLAGKLRGVAPETLEWSARAGPQFVRLGQRFALQSNDWVCSSFVRCARPGRSYDR